MEEIVEAFEEELVDESVWRGDWVKLGMRGGQTKFVWP